MASNFFSRVAYVVFLLFPSLFRADTASKSCSYAVDVGFLMDSSGSMENYFDKEKTFIKGITAKFGLSERGMHAGVVVFSSKTRVRLLIPFNKHTDIASFNRDVDGLPLYKLKTRIDKALTVANTQLFTTHNGSRPGIKKVLFLITDGMQQPTEDKYGVKLDPVKASEPLHEKGIQIFAIAVGMKTNEKELAAITRSKSRVTTLKNFDDLITDDFIKKIAEKICYSPAEKNTSTQKPTSSPRSSTTTRRTTARTTTTTATTTTTTATTTTTTATTKPTKQGTSSTSTATTSSIKTTTTTKPTTEAKQCACSECNGERTGDDCGDCESDCSQKPEVYINVFNGADENNFLMQGTKVAQNGNSNSMDAPKKPKDMTSSEIAKMLKDWLPYHKEINEHVAELLRRSIAAKRKNNKIK